MGAAGIALGAVQAVGGYAQSTSQNRSIKSANASALQANAANAAYLDQKNSLDQSQLAKKYAKFVASEAALMSAKGTYGSASSTAAELSAVANALVDSSTLDFNTRANKNSNNAATRNQIMQNDSQRSNPLFAAISAGANGALMGYQLGSSFFGPSTEAIKTAGIVKNTGVGVGFGYGSFFQPF